MQRAEGGLLLQRSLQSIEDIDGSSTENKAKNDATIRNPIGSSIDQENDQEIKDIDGDSDASNDSDNEANINNDSDDNDGDLETHQNIDGVKDGSEAHNSGENSA